MWNGRAVLVTLSEESETGFLNVLKQPGGRKKPFYVKFKPDGEKRQRTLPGSSSASAWEAACKYGYYLATKAELPETEARNPSTGQRGGQCPTSVLLQYVPHPPSLPPAPTQATLHCCSSDFISFSMPIALLRPSSRA